jgi:hypothetical protein
MNRPLLRELDVLRPWIMVPYPSLSFKFIEIVEILGKTFNWARTIDVEQLGRQDNWSIYRGQ